VQTFKNGVEKIYEDVKDLKLAVSTLLHEYRACPHPLLSGDSPAQRFLGRTIKCQLDFIALPPPEKSASTVPDCDENMPNEQSKAKCPKKLFDEGDLIWVKDYSGNGKWTEAVILDKAGEFIYKVKLERNGAIRTAHKDQIKSRKLFGLRSQAVSPAKDGEC
jgi:hypothetical protein